MTAAEKSDFIFSLTCLRNLSETEVIVLCAIAGVSYPPVQVGDVLDSIFEPPKASEK